MTPHLDWVSLAPLLGLLMTMDKNEILLHVSIDKAKPVDLEITIVVSSDQDDLGHALAEFKEQPAQNFPQLDAGGVDEISAEDHPIARVGVGQLQKALPHRGLAPVGKEGSVLSSAKLIAEVQVCHRHPSLAPVHEGKARVESEVSLEFQCGEGGGQFPLRFWFEKLPRKDLNLE